jgi:hypothetical protein
MARRKKQNEDLPQENLDSSDDTFGLPEIEYEPLRRDEPQPEEVHEDPVSPPEEIREEPPYEQPYAQEETYDALPSEQELPKEEFAEDTQFYEPQYSYTYQDERPAIWPRVLGVILIIALVGAGVWYFVSYRPKQLAEEARERRELLAIQEEARKKAAEQQAEQERLAEQQRQAAAGATAEESATPPPGTIETVSGRSGTYYVVVASSIDGDLIMDYAKKLSSSGVTSKIIPPFGKSQFHRLAIAEGDSYANAQATADGIKGGEYGNDVWVVKY